MDERKSMEKYSGKRAAGPVEVQPAERIFSIANIDERTDMMVENRCEVLIHNLDKLRVAEKLSQAELCAVRFDGLPSSPQLAQYRNRGRDIPFRTMCRIASAFNLPVEKLIGEVLDFTPAAEENPQRSNVAYARADSVYMKYVGNYGLAYFNTDKQIGQNGLSTPDSIRYGILTIYREQLTASASRYRAIAAFNRGGADLYRRIGGILPDKVLKGVSGDEAVALYSEVMRGRDRSGEKPDSEKQEDTSYQRYIYVGDVKICGKTLDISLSQLLGTDAAHLSLHNRAEDSAAGKSYQGGIAVSVSTSRGSEHMPCMQTVLLSRNGFRHWAPEEMAKYLYLQPPLLEIRNETRDIVRFALSLFAGADGDSNPLSDLSEEDKMDLLEDYAEKKLLTPLRRNYLSYYKIPISLDSDVYGEIKREEARVKATDGDGKGDRLP